MYNKRHDCKGGYRRMNNVNRLWVRMPLYWLLVPLLLGVVVGLGGCGGGGKKAAEKPAPAVEQPKEQPKEEAKAKEQPKEEKAAPDVKALIDKGKQLAQGNGCLSCHSTDGSQLVGPTWKGLYGSKVELTDGSTVTADEAYLKQSIADPDSQVVKGYQPIMPEYPQLSEEDIQALVEYIKSLK